MKIALLLKNTEVNKELKFAVLVTAPVESNKPTRNRHRLLDDIAP